MTLQKSEAMDVPEISKTSCISCFNKILMTLSFRPIMAWISARFSYQVRANEFVSQISPCARSQQQPRIPRAPPKVFRSAKKDKPLTFFSVRKNLFHSIWGRSSNTFFHYFFSLSDFACEVCCDKSRKRFKTAKM